MPPTGSTSPRSVTSPVIAHRRSTGRPVAAEISAVASVTPAEGPSFGTAPAGTWMCTSWVLGTALGRVGVGAWNPMPWYDLERTIYMAR